MRSHLLVSRAFRSALFAGFSGVVAAASLPAALLLQDPTPQEIFAETLHEVRELRGLAIGRPIKLEVLSAAKLAARLAAVDRRTVADAPILGVLGICRPKLAFARTLGRTAAQMMTVAWDARAGKVYIAKKSEKLGRYVRKLLGCQAVSLALDAERYQLERRAREAKSFDARFVLDALHEGAALSTMGRWAIGHRENWTMPERLGLQKWEAARNQASMRAPLVFSRRMAAGLLGRYFLSKGKADSILLPQISSGLSERIEATWRKPPHSSEQILHPEKFWSHGKRDEPVVLAGEAALVQGLAKLAGTKLRAVETLGEFGCGLATSPFVRRIPEAAMKKLVGKSKFWSSRASAGWGGDRLFVFDHGKQSSAVWVTVWDSDRDAREFAGVYASKRGKRAGFKAQVSGRLALFASGAMASKLTQIRTLVISKAQPRKQGRAFALGDTAASTPH